MIELEFGKYIKNDYIYSNITMNRLLIPKKIKMIVLDMAGTTVNENGIVYNTLYSVIRDFGLPIKQNEIKNWYGINKYEVLDHFLNKSDKLPINDSVRSELYQTFEETLMNNYNKPGKLNLIDDNMPELFNKIREQDIKIALNTGYSKKIQSSIINILNMNEFIDDFISSEQVLYGRPYPYMINSLIEKNGLLSTNQVMKIGDTKNDILEGLNANCGSIIGVLSGSHNKDILINSGATNVIDSVMDLDI